MIELNLLKFLNIEFPLGEENIISFVNTAPHRYKTYEILKKDGKNKRKIAQPSNENYTTFEATAMSKRNLTSTEERGVEVMAQAVIQSLVIK